jgi:hypothetical protein
MYRCIVTETLHVDFGDNNWQHCRCCSPWLSAGQSVQALLHTLPTLQCLGLGGMPGTLFVDGIAAPLSSLAASGGFSRYPIRSDL